MRDFPLVSVGIPTYNRFVGLRRTLNQITSQTYSNLEIIVSDNCSPNKEIKEIVEEFMQKDSRIKYFRQEINTGITSNFKFVLAQATGEYYMWASDDDEWSPTFIETCLKYIGDAGLVMQNRFKTILRKSAITKSYEGPILSTKNSTFDNIILFYRNSTPSLIYGLFKRETIIPFLADNDMDIIDVFILVRHILKYGINTFPEQLYTAGIDAEDYEFKPINISQERLFEYKPFLKYILREIRKSNNLSFKQKLIISKNYFFKTLWYFTYYEKTYQQKLVKIVTFFLKGLIYTNNIICKLTKTKNYYIVDSLNKKNYIIDKV